MRKGQWFVLVSAIFLILLGSLLYYYTNFYETNNLSFQYTSIALLNKYFENRNLHTEKSEFIKNYFLYTHSICSDKGYNFQGYVLDAFIKNNNLYLNSYSYIDNLNISITINNTTKNFILPEKTLRQDTFSIKDSSLKVSWNITFNSKTFNNSLTINPDSFTIYYFRFNNTKNTYVYQGFRGSETD